MKKKRILSALTAAIAASSMLGAMPANASETVRLMGDMNGDMKITALDAQITLNLYANSLVGNEDNTANAENGNADIDMNGIIDVNDAQDILNYFCQTLVGGQPLWADLREVSYHDGTEYVYNTSEKNEVPFEMTGLYLEIGCAQGAPGETVTVPVYIAGIEDLIGMVMFIDPPEGLTPVDITSDISNDYDAPSPLITIDPVFNPERGAMVWADAENIQIQDGYIIANYTYTIPEDAASGSIYPLCFNPEKCEFIADTTELEESGTFTLASYQYTTLNGVIIVT